MEGNENIRIWGIRSGGNLHELLGNSATVSGGTKVEEIWVTSVRNQFLDTSAGEAGSTVCWDCITTKDTDYFG